MKTSVTWKKEIATIENDLMEARTQPQKFAERCLARVKMFKDKVYSFDKDQLSCETEEGAAACENASNELKGLTPLSKLARHEALDQYASEICNQLCQSGALTSNLSDHPDIQTKLSGLGASSGTLICCVSINSLNVDDIVLNMIIDDGLPSRQNRRDILSPATKFVGIGYRAEHPKGKHLTVLLLVESVTFSPQPAMTESIFNDELQHQRDLQDQANYKLIQKLKDNVDLCMQAHKSADKEERPNIAFNQQAEEYNPYLAPNYPYVSKQ